MFIFNSIRRGSSDIKRLYQQRQQARKAVQLVTREFTSFTSSEQAMQVIVAQLQVLEAAERVVAGLEQKATQAAKPWLYQVAIAKTKDEISAARELIKAGKQVVANLNFMKEKVELAEQEDVSFISSLAQNIFCNNSFMTAPSTTMLHGKIGSRSSQFKQSILKFFGKVNACNEQQLRHVTKNFHQRLKHLRRLHQKCQKQQRALNKLRDNSASQEHVSQQEAVLKNAQQALATFSASLRNDVTAVANSLSKQPVVSDVSLVAALDVIKLEIQDIDNAYIDLDIDFPEIPLDIDSYAPVNNAATMGVAAAAQLAGQAQSLHLRQASTPGYVDAKIKNKVPGPAYDTVPAETPDEGSADDTPSPGI